MFFIFQKKLYISQKKFEIFFWCFLRSQETKNQKKKKKRCDGLLIIAYVNDEVVKLERWSCELRVTEAKSECDDSSL